MKSNNLEEEKHQENGVFEMQGFVTLTCPSCGGKLEITNDLERFACAHCGNEHMVRRSGGVVSLAPVVQELRSIKSGVDRTAMELAIRRIKEEISEAVLPDTDEAFVAIAKSDSRRVLFGRIASDMLGLRLSAIEKLFGMKESRLKSILNEITDDQLMDLIERIPQGKGGDEGLVRNALSVYLKSREVLHTIRAKREQLASYMSMV